MPMTAADLLQRLELALWEPFRAVISDASSKLWWPDVVIGLILAALFSAGGLARLLDRGHWFNRSARNDVLILFINPVLQVTLLAALALNFSPVVGWVSSTLHWMGVQGTATGWTAILLGLALTVALFVADDLARWATHYLQHRIPALWEFHKVHHSAETLNFLTVQRHHPLDPLLTTVTIALVTAAVNGVFIGLFGDQLTIVTIAGANVFRVAANALGGVLRHSPFWLGFAGPVERWLVSPAMHHIHHSSDPRHYDGNFGTALSVWDRMAGTLVPSQGQQVTDFGLGEETRQFQTLAGIYLGPIEAVARRFGLPRRRQSC